MAAQVNTGTPVYRDASTTNLQVHIQGSHVEIKLPSQTILSFALPLDGLVELLGHPDEALALLQWANAQPA